MGYFKRLWNTTISFNWVNPPPKLLRIGWIGVWKRCHQLLCFISCSETYNIAKMFIFKLNYVTQILCKVALIEFAGYKLKGLLGKLTDQWKDTTLRSSTPLIQLLYWYKSERNEVSVSSEVCACMIEYLKPLTSKEIAIAILEAILSADWTLNWISVELYCLRSQVMPCYFDLLENIILHLGPRIISRHSANLFYMPCSFYSRSNMSILSRLSLHLLVITTTLLTLSAIQAEANDETMQRIVSLRDFRAVQARCVSRKLTHTIEIDDNCHVTVDTRKCMGWCPSWTDVILGPPHFVKFCSCCQAERIIYELKIGKCHLPKEPENYTGRTVQLSVPTELECACHKCKW